MTDARILCVDPDEAAREEVMEGLEGALEGLDASIEAAGSFVDAETTLQEHAVDCLITEYDLPGGTGLDLIDRARAVNPDTGCILFTSADHGTIDTDGFGGTITEYLGKDAPHAIERLGRLVRTTVTARSQTAYPLPQEEDERIGALRTYDLDSGDLKRTLRRITDLAARHFDLPTASVNVIDEYSQEFLACHGESASWDRTPREDSICTFTILEDDGVMAVEDVREDPRFADNETIEELGIRAYMGANLISPAGLAIGTLCVYDEEPHSFSEADREYLKTLAEVTMDLIEAHYRAEQSGRGSSPDDAASGGER